MKQIQTKQKLMQISQTSFGQKMIEKFDEEELLNLDTDEILQRHVEELEKGRKEHAQRLLTQQRKSFSILTLMKFCNVMLRSWRREERSMHRGSSHNRRRLITWSEQRGCLRFLRSLSGVRSKWLRTRSTGRLRKRNASRSCGITTALPWPSRSDSTE